MKSFLLLTLLVFGVLSRDTEVKNFKIEDNVLVLTENDFFQATAQFDLMMIEFYSPTCAKCKQLAPEYAKVGAHYIEDKTIKIGKIIESKENRDFTNQFKITHFPTLLIFYKGTKVKEFEGERTEKEITKFVEYMKDLLLQPITKNDQFENILKEFEAVLVYFGKNSDDISKFTSAKSPVMKLICADELIMKNNNIKERTIVLFKHYDEKRNEFEIQGEIKEEELEKFIAKYSKRYVFELDYDMFMRVFLFEESGLVLYDNCEDKEKCEKNKEILYETSVLVNEFLRLGKLSKEEEEKLSRFSFVRADITKQNNGILLLKSQQKLTKYTEYPFVRIHNSKPMEKFSYTGALNSKDLAMFVLKFLKGKLSMKSDL